ncbi:sensor of ECF-type sigma factor [Mariniflexile soesokkakense]|uniref:Sensor of ECF-type sigma factor n=1 Tax=Mariniflexile soesokkakense TaxID=1343160 RepID=A0ABV0ABK0_9FLAO
MKTLTSILVILSFSLITVAQSNRDKIKTLKIAYITEKLNLSEKEAQKFWPIYNAFEDENSRLRTEAYEARKKINFETITEDDAKQILKESRLNDNKKQAIENEFINNLTKVISAKKIILLHKIEDDFKRKMFDEYKKRGRP